MDDSFAAVSLAISNFDINNMTSESLRSLELDKVISLVLLLNDKNDKLKQQSNSSTVQQYEKRLVRIEREINLCQQYSRRDTIEILV